MVKAALIVLVLLAGCAASPGSLQDPRRIWCDHNSPQRLSPDIVMQMDRADLDAMNAHNGKGERWCGWTP